MSLSPSPIRVAVVEDRVEDREGLMALLRSVRDLECVAVCASASEALETLPKARPEIVLMDIQMAGLSGIECVRDLRPLLPDAQFMMLTVVEDHELIFRSLSAGATGYLLKKTPNEKLLEAIRELHRGGAPMSGQIARQVVTAFRQNSPATSTASGLSPIEQKILHLLARGYLYKEVADNLGIAISTVRTHIWHIYRKLQVHNRTEAVLKGLPRPGA